ncbi:MAG TPA: PHB depolymerase family esterase [Kofleriaceae bacterium]|nr:PHB depolymerase family esterase [Kofleriaceae bacterium]
MGLLLRASAALTVLVVACSPGGGGMGTGDDAPDAAVTTPMPDAATTTAANCDGKTAQPLDATWNITVGSAMRVARVHVPASYSPQSRTPLVLDIHGRSGWGSQQAALAHAIAKSDAEGFIVIHPEGTGSPTSWNSGGGCCDPAAANNVDDVGFMRAILDKAEAQLCVDPARIYAMGLSNGGYLAHRIACDLGDRVAAIGAVAGLLQGNCTPARPVPVWMVHGTSDTLVDYSWVPATVNFWDATNGCSTESTTYTHGDASCVTHAGCTANASLVLCTIQGGGHQWPGGDALPFLGKKSDDIIATDALWDFFVAHPLPSAAMQ